MRFPIPAAALTVSVLALALVGCGSASDPDTKAGTASPAGSDAGAADVSPLEAYFVEAGGGNSSKEVDLKKVMESQRKFEEAVAACMSEQGFTYKPNVVDIADLSDGKPADPQSREWVEENGYGVVGPTRQSEATEEENVDPNKEHVDSLSESERDAYEIALYGVIVTPAEGETSEEPDPENLGCYGEANKGGREKERPNPAEDERFADLMTRIGDFYGTWSDLPGIAKLNEEWAACMFEAGESEFGSPQDAAASIADKLAELEGDAAPDASGAPRGGEEIEALRTREIELALTDLTCKEKTSYLKKERKIQFEVEEEFVAENKAELEAFKAAAEQGE